MMILTQILLALAFAGLTMWLTTVYWQRFYHRQMNDSHLQRMKDHVTSSKQAQTLKSRADFLIEVLSEVQRQHEGLSSYMRLLSSANLQPGQEEWNLVSSQLKERAGLLGEMVNGSLSLMKYEEMTEIARDDTVMVNQFCLDVFDSCQPYLNGHVELRLETELDDDETIRSNQKCLQQVLTNLIRCSMQFTHEGEIVLEVKHHRQKQQHCLMFTLSDTGLGIPEESKEIAFEQMTGEKIANKIVVVRLRLCRALVKLLGGNINLDPLREKGTAMVFTVRDAE
jgi:signal transduction histidine kinase